MTPSFVYSFQSEWLKKKRSLSSWIVIIGGFFTPLIILIARLVHHDKLPLIYYSVGFWKMLWNNAWESMAIFLLPMGVILATSLITQIEYKNNTWKQLHTVPLKLTTIFFSKLAVIVVMMLQFFILFNIGIYLSAVIPSLLISRVPYPKAAVPYLVFLRENVFFFIDCLPIIALQYLISLKFKNFLVPVGTGFLLWIAALTSLSWKYGYLVPYTYCMFNYLKGDVGGRRAVVPVFNIHLLAMGYFVVFTILSYMLYISKREKG
jgi:lantibiotic transport system permease protein